jgi:hypothetical protein
MRIFINAIQEETTAVTITIRSAQREFQETITKLVEVVLESVGQRAQNLCKELDSEIQGTQLDIQPTEKLVEGTRSRQILAEVNTRAGRGVAGTR